MVAESDLDSWATTEFSKANLGDARLTKQLILLAEQLAKMPHSSFPHSLAKAQLKSAYRFFDNQQVDTDGALGSHIAQTQNRMNQVPIVLAVQDTTEFNLTHLPATEGLGYCSNKLVRGFMMHSMLAVTPEGLPLGVLGMKAWARDLSELGKKKQHVKKPIDEKESVKQLEGIKQLTALKAGYPKTHMISVCDREADIYDLFVAPRPDGVDWLIRASWNRKVDHPDQYLWEAMASAPELGCIELNVPARSNCAQRIAQLAIKCAPVTLRRPCNHQDPNLPNVEVFAIWVLESHPPEGANPIEWMLLSSVPTHTQEQALERLTWYARRWTIETWHRSSKVAAKLNIVSWVAQIASCAQPLYLRSSLGAFCMRTYSGEAITKSLVKFYFRPLKAGKVFLSIKQEFIWLCALLQSPEGGFILGRQDFSPRHPQIIQCEQGNDLCRIFRQPFIRTLV